MARACTTHDTGNTLTKGVERISCQGSMTPSLACSFS